MEPRFVALPPLWKPVRASGAAHGMEPLHLHSFSRAPGRAAVGAEVFFLQQTHTHIKPETTKL
jgi:hypothetical protein